VLHCPAPHRVQYAELRARLEQVQSADVLVGLMDKMRSEMQRQTIRCVRVAPLACCAASLCKTGRRTGLQAHLFSCQLGSACRNSFAPYIDSCAAYFRLCCQPSPPPPSICLPPSCSYHDLSGRPKHLWGVFKKMAAKGYSLGRISDVRGLRIIVDTKADCYRALRAVEVRAAAIAAALNCPCCCCAALALGLLPGFGGCEMPNASASPQCANRQTGSLSSKTQQRPVVVVAGLVPHLHFDKTLNDSLMCRFSMCIPSPYACRCRQCGRVWAPPRTTSATPRTTATAPCTP
jgi:hypothetical protein